MKCLNALSLKVTSVETPRVHLVETHSPSSVSVFAKWSEDHSIEELHSAILNKIELELSDERTRIQSSSDLLLRGDSSLYMMISGIESFVETYKSLSSDNLIEFSILIQSEYSYVWASLGHFALLGVRREEIVPLFVAQDYSYESVRIPRRGLGLSDKREVIYGEIGYKEYDKFLITHGVTFVPKSYTSIDSFLKEQSGSVGSVWAQEILL
jgi:hypothetical protein